MTLNEIGSLVASRPCDIRMRTVNAVATVLASPRHSRQTKAIFLYRSASQILFKIISARPESTETARSLDVLKGIATAATQPQHQAASEALGSLPLAICGPGIRFGPLEKPPAASYRDICNAAGLPSFSRAQRIGRSLVTPLPGSRQLLVVKLGRGSSAIPDLAAESTWIKRFQNLTHRLPLDFKIPHPVCIHGEAVFRFRNSSRTTSRSRREISFGTAFLVHEDYYRYPNDHRRGWRLSSAELRRVLNMNAALLARLTAEGIVHTAPIPLFHNRIQRNRRQDQGLYQWQRGGRLDQWLFSARFPNFGKTGIRDFEHFVSIASRKYDVYEVIGMHLLSLVLVLGSHFRNKTPESFGRDEFGNPVDMRHLFDKPLFEQLLMEIAAAYYENFVGRPFPGKLPFDFSGLADRLIDSMGIDTDMEEILRSHDRQQMSTDELKDFLRQKGVPPETIQRQLKVPGDIAIQTGPHLGGFNQKISVPELITYLEIFAALSVAGRYEQNMERKKSGSANRT